MLGLPGSGFLESRLMGAGTLSTFEQVTGLLGLNAGNAPVLLSLGSVQFSLNTAALQTISRNTESNWAQVPRIGHLDALQYTGPGSDVWTIPCDLYPDWKGSANVIEALRMMARSGDIYFLIGANGDVIGLFIVRSVTEEQSLYKSNGTPRKHSFTLTLQRFVETASQKAEAKKGGALLGSVGRFVNSLENGITGAVGTIENVAGGAIEQATSAVDGVVDQAAGAVGGAIDSATSAVDGAIASATDPISRELGL